MTRAAVVITTVGLRQIGNADDALLRRMYGRRWRRLLNAVVPVVEGIRP